MPIPVLTVDQMREWERLTWASGKTEQDVIAEVGRVLARRALELTGPGARILVLAGKGHNGDDARAAVPHLAGRKVRLVNVVDPAGIVRDWGAVAEPAPDLVIDGMFGIGLSRELSPDWCELIQLVNGLECPVLAVDVPSGLNADTGEHFGAAVRATVTLTVGAPKIGLIRHAAADYVGKLEVAADVGLVPCPLTSEMYWLCRSDFVGFPPARKAATHKGTYGRLAIIAGSVGYHGAAVLAALGAQRAQPGLITLFVHEPVYVPVASQLKSVMVRPLVVDAFNSNEFTAVLVGPGLAAPNLPSGLPGLIRRLWRDAQVPVIVDASALDWLASEPVAPNLIRVVTPHPGEAARMLKATVDWVQQDRIRAVREISSRYGSCYVVLKGYLSLIGRAAGPVFVNGSGNPHLAQGGAGDVLAGFLAGLLAQPLLQHRAEEAIRFAVWAHGVAADRLEIEKPNWVIDELTEVIGWMPSGQSENSV